MSTLTIWNGPKIPSLPVTSDVIRICILSVNMLLIGCQSGHLTRTGLLGVCDGLNARRMDFIAQRSTARTAMERDVELGRHSVPGQTLDAAGRRDAEAYVQRIRDRWQGDDSRIAHALADIDATLHEKGCRP